MANEERANGTLPFRETHEEAAAAIANALEFLRIEAAALGMVELSLLIGIARAKTRDYQTICAAGRTH